MDPIRGMIDLTPGPLQEGHRGGENEGPSFSETLQGLYREVDSQLKYADRKAAEFAVGNDQNIHEVMIAAERAGIGFRFLLEIRNKLLEAYQEIMRMQF